MKHIKADIKPGDWVSFCRNGAIVIGRVWYVGRLNDDYPQTTLAFTDVGSVHLDGILEVRRGQQP